MASSVLDLQNFSCDLFRWIPGCSCLTLWSLWSCLAGTIVVVYSSFEKHKGPASVLPTMMFHMWFDSWASIYSLVYLHGSLACMVWPLLCPWANQAHKLHRQSQHGISWYILLGAILTGQARNEVKQIKNKNPSGDCEQDFDDLRFTTLGSKRLETWPILPTNFKLQLQVLISRRVFVETLNKLQYNTDVNHLKADGS